MQIIWHKRFLFLLLLTACQSSDSTSEGNALRLPNDPAVKKQMVNQLLQHLELEAKALNLFIRVLKKEQILEVWGKKEGDHFQKIIDYPFCKSTGVPGPKRREGDLQIPEGFYHIDRFNPKSKFFLSLGLNYPNASDRILGDPQSPGSDIFIHGDCVTVGCVPITDAKILELYLLAEQARANGQTKIPVHIFPARMRGPKWQNWKKEYPQHQGFWNELQVAYSYFENFRKVPIVAVGAAGEYLVDL